MLVDPPVTLGHRRLSILDLSPAGHGPMASPDGAQWITYNGEVYNYLELARELRTRGHRFDSSCDTEVLLHAYGEWGPDALPRLNGMFAFAIWDRRRRELFCARDRFGIKPFYYTVAGGRFRFASEIKALLIDPEVARRPNHDRIVDFLAFELADHTAETMFEGIYQLPPGCFFTVSPKTGLGSVRRWYEAAPADLGGARFDEAVRERLFESVALRLRSDVPVGTCLSGGLDSSSVVTIASRLRADEGAPPPDSFTARCEDPRLDEMPHVRSVVAATGSRNHTVLPTAADVTDHLDTVLWHMDEPFHASSVVAQWKVMQLARAAGVTVLLDGQGGDEVFAGYRYMCPGFFYSLARQGRLLSARREILARARLHSVPASRTLVELAKLSAPRRLRGRTVPDWLDPDIAVPRRPFPARPIHGQQLYGLTTWPLPFYLHHEDRNSMSFGLEARVPFLDFGSPRPGSPCAPTAHLERPDEVGPAEVHDRRRAEGDRGARGQAGLLDRRGELAEGGARSRGRGGLPERRRAATVLPARIAARGARVPPCWNGLARRALARLLRRALAPALHRPPRLTAPRPGEGAPTTSVRAADRVVRLGVSDPLPA